jgi:hypothetical protein
VGEGVIIHLVGPTEEEANASMDEYGDPDTCSQGACSESAVVALIIKKPGSGWGQDIHTAAACEEHKPELLAVLKDITQ